MTYRIVDANVISDRHPVRVFGSVWDRLANGGGLPEWRLLDPAKIAAVLPWIMLFREEATEASPRLRCRICGEGCREVFGFTYQGRLFGDGFPVDELASRLEEFARVCRGHGPVYSAANVVFPKREFIDLFRGVFAFHAEGKHAYRIIVVLAPQDVRI